MNSLKYLNQMLDHIIEENQDSADIDFHNYLRDKLKEKLHTPEEKEAIPTIKEVLNLIVKKGTITKSQAKKLRPGLEQALNDIVTSTTQAVADETRAELTNRWIVERDQLIESVDAKFEKLYKSELKKLRRDVEVFRDLESEYAEKLVEAKAAMSDELKDDLMELVEKVDDFLEMRITEEFKELKGDVEQLQRKDEINRVLSPLSGKERETMEAILRTIPTDRLQEAYDTFIDRVKS